MNQNAFISQLDDVPWDTSDQNPGLTYKLLIDASNAESFDVKFEKIIQKEIDDKINSDK